jgi:hypothetical protein
MIGRPCGKRNPSIRKGWSRQVQRPAWVGFLGEESWSTQSVRSETLLLSETHGVPVASGSSSGDDTGDGT